MFASRIFADVWCIYPIAKAVGGGVVQPNSAASDEQKAWPMSVVVLGPGSRALSGWGIVGPGLMAAAMVTIAILM